MVYRSLFLSVMLASSPLLSFPEKTCVRYFDSLSQSDQTEEKKIWAFARALLEKKGKTIEKRKEREFHGIDRKMETVSVEGLPETARLLSPEQVENLIFRHYIHGDSHFDESKTTGFLVSAAVSYVQVAPGLERKIFDDVTGLFLTLPSVSATDVGLEHRSDTHHLDLKIPKDIPVIELEKDKIYVIPMPRRYHPWVLEYYAKYLKGESLSQEYLKMCQNIHAREGSHRDISKIWGVKLEILKGE